MENDRIEQLCKIRSSFASLSKTQQKIAQFVLTHTDELGQLTITQLAGRLNVDPSSITRFCQTQGFKGYSNFRFLMTHDLASSVPAESAFIQPDDSVAQILKKMQRYTQRAIGDVLELLDPKQIEQAAQAIYNAKSVQVYAQGGSISSAQYTQFMFLQIGIPCHCFFDRLLALPASETLGPDDVALAISFSGAAKIVVDAVSNAKKRKARIVGISGFQSSALARHADLLLCYNSRVPDDIRYLHMIYICELTIISAIHFAIINKYHNELALSIANANQEAKRNRYWIAPTQSI